MPTVPPHRRGTTAVIRAGGLGDVLLTLPAIHELRSRPSLRPGHHPARTIEAVGYPALWRAAGPVVDRVESIDDPRFAALYGDGPSPDLAVWLNHRSLVAWTASPLGAWVGDLVPLIQISPYPPPGLHAAAWLLESLGADGKRGLHNEPEGGWLALTPMERAAGAARLAAFGLERPTVIHPGAGADWKRWPGASFARLVAALQVRGHQVALVEGPADGEAAEGVLERTGPLPVIREPDLRVLARMLAAARLFIGNDSGVTHLAAMAGTATIALFGPTDPASWAPLGHVQVVRRCRQGAVRQGQIRVCDGPDCMAAITVDDVLEVIDIVC